MTEPGEATRVSIGFKTSPHIDLSIDQGEMLCDALTNLSPEHREIIDLVYYHEMSVDDAADILSIPRATVKTRMFYARKKLADLVHQQAA